MAQQSQLQHSTLPFRGRRVSSDSCSSSDAEAAAALPPKLGLRNTKLSTISMNEDCRQHIQRQCERFDRYNMFLGNASGRHDLPSSIAVQETIAEIDQIMMRTERAIQAKLGRLRKEIDQFTDDVPNHANPLWYRRIGDLTYFDGSKFTEMLRSMRIRDYRGFAEYLKETLPAASDKIRPHHEYGETTFVGKVHMLLNNVVSYATYRVSFSLFATVKAKVLVVGKARVPQRTLEKELEYVDSQLLWLMRLHTQFAEKDDYWDFAASWRLLVNAWEEMPAETGFLLRLLGSIREKAEQEIRYRSDIAVNGRLPQELADLVFEQAMTSEELPPGS